MRVFCIIIASIAFASLGHPAAAQQATPRLPEAILLIQPIEDDAVVAITYSKRVAHAQAKQDVLRLARIAGWKVGDPVARDETLNYVNANGEKSPIRQTGVEARATNVSLLAPAARDPKSEVRHPQPGLVFKLQPYAEALRRLGRFDVLLLTGPVTPFAGVRRFHHPALTVELTRDGGPYRYRFDVHEQSGALPAIPLSEPFSAAQPQSTTKGSTEEESRSLGTILIIAGAAGLAAFAFLRMLTALSRGRSGAGPRRRPSLHSGPYIVSRRKD